MSKKTRHSITDNVSVGKLVAFSLVMLYLCYAIYSRINAPLTSVSILISKSEEKKHLIKSKEVKRILKDKLGHDISLAEVGQLDLYDLENYLEEDHRINTVDMYVDKNMVLHISVEERKPIVRIQIADGPDYYLDYKGRRIPVAEVFRVPVVTGFVDKYKENYQSQSDNNHKGLLILSQLIYDNEFLSSLVEQIYIDKNDKVTLVPKLGPDRLLVGKIFTKDDPSNVQDYLSIEEKLENIELYYKHGIKDVGLETFEEMDFSYGSFLNEDESQIFVKRKQS